ncbi:hypothetical protein KUT37_20675, partial [Pseudomonas aeruginosa]|nr:hypothetical protein [Pseudomonas aeruginosa]
MFQPVSSVRKYTGKTSRRRTLIAPIRRLLKAADTSGLFFGSSHFPGEGGLDFQEEVIDVPEAI